MIATADRIPLSVVTGFLGSGKTTLIAGLLSQPTMEGTAVIVNEIGVVGIDDAIFADKLDSDDVMLLANGCMCCAAGDDLGSMIWTLASRPVPARRIIIETSGLADPAPVLHRLMGDLRVRRATRLDAVVATIDAINGRRDLGEQPLSARQCAVADRRLITKADISDPGEVAALKQDILVLNPGASVECATNGRIDAGRVFGASLFDPERGRADLERWLNLDGYRAGPAGGRARDVRFAAPRAHGLSAATWLIEETRPVDWSTLAQHLGRIVARHGDWLLRLKGVIHTHGDPRPLVIHGVQGLFHSPVRLDRWSRSPATSIVAIGDQRAEEAVELITEALADSVTGTCGKAARARTAANRVES